ncbi:U3 small nucleolar RNA-associated protein 14 homolog A isoform X1 [Frieseomelitta varia]|uniref:U3 small nucleolar RNA-associated protein 14 homolog A isoform X1 n=1 Tax=Frieseomelitta varia TaxID=561572 RepID=UPI001CB678FD|nr:U3 small nucleolar RNA-associated protein 14 homolog A isoform X1 [Frieseomelitta varia]
MVMSTDYLEELDDTEKDVSESHSKLLEAVSQLDKGQRVKKAERSEPTLEVSEFHLVKSGICDRDAVHVHDLAKTLGQKSHHHEITKNLQAIKRKIQVLPKPLEKPAADRIKRIVGFKNTKQELKKWNAIITKNRTAESLHFPLKQSSIKLDSSTEFVKRFRLQSDLEKELAALEPQKDNIEEKSDEFSLTLKEIIMKRKEAARIRAQQSYREAKAHRQNKIKSKKFHRVQRKEKIKLQLKEFEELQKTNPEAALEKLDQLDKTRAEERMTLRHKNTGRWAKSKQIRAKYDKETRKELAQQLSVGRELTQKFKKSNDSEEEDVGDDTPMQFLTSDKENPWIGNVKTESEIDQFVKSYRKYWDDQNKKLEGQNINSKITTENKKINNPLKDTQPSILNGTDAHVNTNSFEIQNNEKIQEAKNLNKPTISLMDSSSRDNNTTNNRQPLETKSRKEYLTKVNVKNVKNKSINNITATSSWKVESIENINTENFKNSNVSNSEKINKLFDFMEEKIQDQIKFKLERITQNYEEIKTNKKRKSKNIKFKDDNFDGLEIQAKKQKPILDLSLNESACKNNLEVNTELEKIKQIKQHNTSFVDNRSNAKVEIDPNKYINIKPKHLNTDLPIDITGGDDVLDDSEDEEKRRNVVSEAFADDDVVEEFRKEKEEEVKKAQPKDIDLTLPGWGNWGGKNIKVSKRKKRRFILKMPKDLPRRDENKGDVIIFEEDNPKIKEHQVNELPYPFSSVKDYEASIRMPIGRNFVSENSHRKLIEPSVKTHMGKVIEPMNEDILVKKNDKENRKFIPKRINKKQKIKRIKTIERIKTNKQAIK